MSIDEIREARRQLEATLLATLEEFRRTTGICVVGIDVRTAGLQNLQQAHGERHVINVTCRLDEI